MPKHYQRKRGNDYMLPDSLYLRVIYTIKDAERLRDAYNGLSEVTTPNLTGMPKQQGVFSPTEVSALKRAGYIYDELRIIEQAKSEVSGFYRDAVHRKICYDIPYDFDKMPRRGVQQAEAKYLYRVAELLGYVVE